MSKYRTVLLKMHSEANFSQCIPCGGRCCKVVVPLEDTFTRQRDLTKQEPSTDSTQQLESTKDSDSWENMGVRLNPQNEVPHAWPIRVVML